MIDCDVVSNGQTGSRLCEEHAHAKGNVWSMRQVLIMLYCHEANITVNGSNGESVL